MVAPPRDNVPLEECAPATLRCQCPLVPWRSWVVWAQVDTTMATTHNTSDRTQRKNSLRTTRPRRVVALPTGCLAYWTRRSGFGVARRVIDPAVLRTGCITRLTGLGNSPRRKLISRPPLVVIVAFLRRDVLLCDQ